MHDGRLDAGAAVSDIAAAGEFGGGVVFETEVERGRVYIPNRGGRGSLFLLPGPIKLPRFFRRLHVEVRVVEWRGGGGAGPERGP